MTRRFDWLDVWCAVVVVWFLVVAVVAFVHAVPEVIDMLRMAA